MKASVGIIMETLEPATHLAILYAHHGEFDRQRKRLRFSPPIDADTSGEFFADRDDVALQPCSRAPSRSVLKSHVIKSPNLIRGSD